MSFLHDSFTQFIISNALTIFFGVTSIFGIILSIIFYKKSRTRKELTWQLISSTRFKKLSEIIIRLWNSGDIAIVQSDFLDSIKFYFGKGSKVLKEGTKILETSPISARNRVEKSFKHGISDVSFEPLLLNSKDSIKFQVHINGYNISNKIILNNLGIIGIHDIHEKRPVTETSNRKLLIYSIVNIIGSQGIGYGLQYLLYPGDRYGPILGPLIFLIILFVKNLGPSVFLFYGVLLISNGISKIIPNGRSKRFQINNMLGVIKFWVGASLLTTITLGLPFILELISQQFPK